MNKEEYKKLVKAYEVKEPRLKNFLIAFFIGGILGIFGQFFIELTMYTYGFSFEYASSILCFILIICGTFFTCCGFFDNWVAFAKCGLIIPTTGFAHSVASSMIDYKKDGMITGLGANFLKLAGSVLLFGITSSFFLLCLEMISFD